MESVSSMKNLTEVPFKLIVVWSSKEKRFNVVKVDCSDFRFLSKIKWYINKNGYAIRYFWDKKDRKVKSEMMHRMILGIEDKSTQVDHVNWDRLDNRRSNLRQTNSIGNAANRKPGARNMSGFKGVSWNKGRKRWAAVVQHLGRIKWIGMFDSKADAAFAYNMEAKRIWGDYAYLNPINLE